LVHGGRRVSSGMRPEIAPHSDRRTVVQCAAIVVGMVCLGYVMEPVHARTGMTADSVAGGTAGRR
jgi:hypothetical protein